MGEDPVVDITVMDVTQPCVFDAEGQYYEIPEEYITPGHSYEVTVTGMTSKLEGKAEFRAGEIRCYS